MSTPPGADKSDPLISPAFGDLSGYPRSFQRRRRRGAAEGRTDLTNAAAKAGVDIRLHVGKDMIHTYPLDLWDYPEAMVAF